MCWQHCLILKNILAPPHCHFFSDCLRGDICFLSTSSIVFNCQATLLGPPKTQPRVRSFYVWFLWQPHLVLFCAPSCICNPILARFSHLHLCSAGWCQHSPSPWTGKVISKDVKKCMFSFTQFIYPFNQKRMVPGQDAGKSLLPTKLQWPWKRQGSHYCVPRENLTPNTQHFVPGGCPSSKNAEFPHIDADKRQVLPPAWLGLECHTRQTL